MPNTLITYDIEGVKKTVGNFYNGRELKDSEILNVVLQIQEDSPEDPVIKLLKEYPDGGKSFRKEVDEIYGSKSRAKKAMAKLTYKNPIVQSFEMAINLLNGRLYEDRELPIKDDFFRNMRKVTEKIEDKILDVM